MDLIYTDIKRKDVGVLKNYEFDLAYGSDENDFELTIDLNDHCCDVDGLIYVENTEYGGIIDGLHVVTTDEKLTYSGRTWHGILESKVIEPDDGESYLVVSGDVNKIIGDLLIRCGLDNLFVASSEESELTVENYQFDRYVGMYTGIGKMLASASGKLKVSFADGKVTLSAVPIVNYSEDEQFDNDSVKLEIEKNKNVVNHIICLGKGELVDRTVIHLYTDENGNVSQKQTFFGLQEVSAVFDYPNVESVEELIKNGTEKFQEYAKGNKVQINFVADEAKYDVGDIVGAKEIITKTEVTTRITKKIVTIREGEVNVQYKVGE